MKNTTIYLVITTVVVGFFSCNSHNPVSDEQSMGKAEMEAVADHMNALLGGDLDKAAEFLTENYMEYGPKVSDSVSREESLQNWKSNFDSTYQSISFDRVATRFMVVGIGESDNPAVIGNWVLEWGNMTVEYKDGSPSTTFWWHGAFRMSGEKIDLMRKFYDRADIMEQKGYEFVKPE